MIPANIPTWMFLRVLRGIARPSRISAPHVSKPNRRGGMFQNAWWGEEKRDGHGCTNVQHDVCTSPFFILWVMHRSDFMWSPWQLDGSLIGGKRSCRCVAVGRAGGIGLLLSTYRCEPGSRLFWLIWSKRATEKLKRRRTSPCVCLYVSVIHVNPHETVIWSVSILLFPTIHPLNVLLIVCFELLAFQFECVGDQAGLRCPWLGTQADFFGNLELLQFV